MKDPVISFIEGAVGGIASATPSRSSGGRSHRVSRVTLTDVLIIDETEKVQLK